MNRFGFSNKTLVTVTEDKPDKKKKRTSGLLQPKFTRSGTTTQLPAGQYSGLPQPQFRRSDAPTQLPRGQYSGLPQSKFSGKYSGLPKRVSSPKKPPKEETIIEWFDRSVEDELNKRRADSLSPKLEVSLASGTSHPQVVQSSTSGIDIQAALRTERTTELAVAVDKLAKAEAAAAFQGAVKAAEAAAASASPEDAEEAAVAGARGYEAELTSVINQKVDGLRPIEVIGYVGITRPRHAIRRNN